VIEQDTAQPEQCDESEALIDGKCVPIEESGSADSGCSAGGIREAGGGWSLGAVLSLALCVLAARRRAAVMRPAGARA